MSKKNNNFFFSNGISTVIVFASIILIGLGLLTKMSEFTRPIKVLSYSDFISQVEADKVASVKIAGKQVGGLLKDGTRFESTILENNPSDTNLMREHKVSISVSEGSFLSGLSSGWLFLMLFLLLPIIAGMVWLIIRQRASGSSNNSGSTIFSMGKSRARMYLPGSIKEKFSSVAGAAEAKEELQDVVEYLKNPEKYNRFGAQVTRGVLLVGDPGNGKTLLAKAVAGEANCAFFSLSGSDFIEVFVGVGASRVRDLFAQARKHSPCIIFIDEIDAVGRQRTAGGGGGNDEREQTLNQLLAEMDGFTTMGAAPVIVLAATNRPDVLDKALLRPGRFDRHVTVPFPDKESRRQILKLHAKDKIWQDAIDIDRLAGRTTGFSGADLANLMNEAALIAAKADGRKGITQHDVEEAYDKIVMGKKWVTSHMTPEDKKLVAYHEAGHALGQILYGQLKDPLHKVTIVPRGRALGVTFFAQERDKHTETKEQKVARIIMTLGGRAAEEVVYNTQDSGVGGDFENATNMARYMVCYLGMSPEVGPVLYKPGYGEFPYSQATAQKIDKAVQDLLQSCLDKAKELLRTNRDKLDALAQALFEKETLDAKEVYQVIGLEYPEAKIEGGQNPDTQGEPAAL